MIRMRSRPLHCTGPCHVWVHLRVILLLHAFPPLDWTLCRPTVGMPPPVRRVAGRLQTVRGGSLAEAVANITASSTATIHPNSTSAAVASDYVGYDDELSSSMANTADGDTNGEEEEGRSREAPLSGTRILTTKITAMKTTVRDRTLQIRDKFSLREKWGWNGTDDAAADDYLRGQKLKHTIARQRRLFLDKIALMSSALLKSDGDADVIDEDGIADDEITHQSDLTLPYRRIVVVTTAALPWMTGTAVNPMLRAAHLFRLTKRINGDAVAGVNNTNVEEERRSDPSHKNETCQVGLPSGTDCGNLNRTNNTTVAPGTDWIWTVDPCNFRANCSDIGQTQVNWQGHTSKTQFVTLVVPWLEREEDRKELYGSSHVFQSPSEQEDYIRRWMREEADLVEESDSETGLKILFYPARYHFGLKSIFAMGDICSLIPDDEADVCILEEPEHLNWYRAPGDGWTKKFNYVVGVVHTNYKEYAAGHYSGLWTSPAIGVMSSAMVRAYCHQVIKLSDVLQTYAPEKEATSNVHGVREEFLREGARRAGAKLFRSDPDVSQDDESDNEQRTVRQEAVACRNVATTGAYFIGKLLWAKGLDRLIELEEYYRQCTGEYFNIDIYGSGPNEEEIKRAFHGRRKKKRTKKKKRKKILKQQNIPLSDVSWKKMLPSYSISFVNGVDGHLNSSLPSSDIIGPSDAISFRHDDFYDSKSSELVEGNDEGQYSSSSPFSTLDVEDHMSYISEEQENSSSNGKYQFTMRQRLEQLSQSFRARTETFEFDFDLPRSRHELRRKPIPAHFHGRVDHALLRGNTNKIFINPSTSEVLCTTTAEALAMGKFAIIPVHPSNTFFMKFPNCLSYRNKLEFAANLKWAISHDPEPLSADLAREFTWEAATERLINAAAITRREAHRRAKLGRTKLDERIAYFHNELGKGAKGDALRKVLGGGPASHQVQYETERKGVYYSDFEDEAEDLEVQEEQDDDLWEKFDGSWLSSAISEAFPLSPRYTEDSRLRQMGETT